MIAVWITADPCPICLRSGWCQTRPGADGETIVMCRRADRHPTLGEGHHKIDRAGVEYWTFRLPAGLAESQPQPRPKKAASTTGPKKKQRAAVAPADVLNTVYQHLLANLGLSADHRDNLLRRGLPDGEIDRRGYASTRSPARRREVIKGMLTEGVATAADLAGVPGFRRTYRGWEFHSAPGLLIPIRDAGGRIVGLQVRVDSPGRSGKYLWASSARWGGPSPGTPIHHPLPIERADLATDPTTLLRITEGGLKADVATALSGVLTLGMPGAHFGQAAATAARRLGRPIVVVAYDRDAWTNEHVGRALKATVHALTAVGLGAVLETWPEAAGKGVDDCLAAGVEPEWLSGRRMERELARAPGESPEHDAAETADASCDGECSCDACNCGDGGKCRSLLYIRKSIEEETATQLPTLTNPCRKVTLHLESKVEPGRRRIAKVPCRRPSCPTCGPINRQEKANWYEFVICRFWPGVWRVECKDAREAGAVKKHVERNAGWYVRFPRPDGGVTMLISVEYHRAEPLYWTDLPELLEKLIREVPEGKHITASREIAFARLDEIKTRDWKLSDIQGALASVPVSRIANVLRELGLAPVVTDHSAGPGHRFDMVSVDYYVPPGAWSQDDHIELLKSLNPLWFWTGAMSVVVRSRAPAGSGAPWFGQRRSRGGILLDATKLEPRAAAAPA